MRQNVYVIEQFVSVKVKRDFKRLLTLVYTIEKKFLGYAMYQFTTFMA